MVKSLSSPPMRPSSRGAPAVSAVRLRLPPWPCLRRIMIWIFGLGKILSATVPPSPSRSQTVKASFRTIAMKQDRSDCYSGCICRLKLHFAMARFQPPKSFSRCRSNLCFHSFIFPHLHAPLRHSILYYCFVLITIITPRRAVRLY